MAAKMLVRATFGTFIQNFQIANLRDGGNHPHLCDAYVPAGQINFVMVVLHGGSGGKQWIPQLLGLTTAANPTVNNINWQMLNLWKVAIIIPQGQHCTGVQNDDWNPRGVDTVSAQYPDGVATWSNGNMYSQADDPQFLQDMAFDIVAKYGTKGRILAGHSNGGMMAQWMHMNKPGYYNYYCPVSGPRPSSLGEYVQGTQMKPIYVRYGGLDDVVGIYNGPAGDGDHFSDDTLIQNPAHKSVADYVAPPGLNTWYGPEVDFAEKVAMRTSGAEVFSPVDGVTTNVSTGKLTTWTYANGACKMDLISAADHGLKSMQKCLMKKQVASWMGWVYQCFMNGVT